MSLRGNLNSVDLANIFQMLSINQKEGTLNIFDGDSKKSIYFSREGVSMLSRGKVKKDSLGRILLRYDRLSDSQLERALEKQRQSGRLLGVILEESNLVPREVIEDALRIQIEEEIYNLFIWKDASFEFIEGVPPREFDEIDGAITRLTFNVNSLIMEAARRIDEWEQIQQVVPSENEVYQYSGQNMELTDDIFREPYVEKVLAAINGRNTVEEIIERSYVNRFEVCKILSLLLEQKAIEPVSSSDLSDAAESSLATGAVPDAIKFLERVVELGQDTPETHLSLGQAYEGQGEISKAAEHYRKFAEHRLTTGAIQEAFELYRRICELLPTDLGAAERMVEIFVSFPDRLEGNGKLIIEKGKVLAEVLLEIGKNSRAVQTLHRVITLDPEDFSLRNLLINIYLANGMSAEAIAEYEAMAEWFARRREWEQVVKILRKILVIDRSREDVNRRLEQLLNRKEKKKKNVRRLIAVVIVVCGLSVLAWGYINYELDARRQTAEAESAAAEMLKELNLEVQPISEQLDELTKKLSSGDIGLEELLEVYRRAEELGKRYGAQVDEAIRKLEEVAAQYKFARARTEAVERQAELTRMRAAFDESIRAAAAGLQKRALALVDQGDRAISEGRGTDALALYRRAWSVATERTALVVRNVEDKIREGEEYVRTVDEKLAEIANALTAGDYGVARATALDLMNLYFIPDVLARVTLPVRVESDPAGAVVLMNGADTGVRTPGWIAIHPGADSEIGFELDGFATGFEKIPAVRAEMQHREMPRLLELQTIRRTLTKEIAWTGRVEGAVQGRPAVSGRVIYAATRASLIWRLDVAKKTAEIVFDARKESVSGYHSAPVIDGDDMIVATLEGLVQRISLKDGATIWKKQGAGMVYAPLALAPGAVLIGDVTGQLTARDARTGDVLWNHRLAGDIRARPTVAENRVYAATTSGNLYVYDLVTGTEVWETVVGATNQSILAAPLVRGNRVYVASTNGKLYAFDLAARSEISSFDAGAEIQADPVEKDGAIVVVTVNGTVHAVRDGASVGMLELGGTLRSAPVVDGDRVLLVTEAGRLVSLAVAANTLRANWRYDLKASDGGLPNVVVSPLLVEGCVGVVSDSGEFFVLDD